MKDIYKPWNELFNRERNQPWDQKGSVKQAAKSATKMKVKDRAVTAGDLKYDVYASRLG